MHPIGQIAVLVLVANLTWMVSPAIQRWLSGRTRGQDALVRRIDSTLDLLQRMSPEERKRAGRLLAETLSKSSVTIEQAAEAVRALATSARATPPAAPRPASRAAEPPRP